MARSSSQPSTSKSGKYVPIHRTLVQAVSLDDHAQGRLHSDMTLVEYGDYQCPSTRGSWLRVNALQFELRGRLLFVFRHFPGEAIHPHARHAAAAAEAAAAQGEFWRMHHYLLQHQEALSAEHLVQYASDLGLDTGRFERDRTSVDIAARIDRDLISGHRSGVRRTPAFFFNSLRYDGPNTLDSLRAALTAAGNRGFPPRHH
jgi:protein-disulfide isomerase